MDQAQHHPSGKTRHKEYSLILTMITIPVLLFMQYNTNLLITVLINLLALITILGAAFSVVRHADVLAHRLGEPYGSLILSLAVVILEVSLISALMVTGDTGPTLMRDTLYSVIMIVMSGLVGISLLLGGRKFATQHVNLAGIKQYLTALLPLAIIVLVLPATFDSGAFSSGQLLIIALLSAGMYIVFLTIQTKTHQNLFIYEHEDEGDGPDEHHGKPSAHGNAWHACWLVIHLVAVIAVTKINAGSLEYLLTELHAPPQFTGFLIALLILSPEGLGALKAVMNNQVQRAMNLFFGSVLATISLTVPAVVVIAMITGQHLVFGLSTSNVVLLVTVLLLCQSSFATGRTNVLNGAAHLAVFVAYMLVLMMG
ncbi:sodium-potassium/proton antiporter ChaA [Limnobaculum parvum]|uniref:Sodium-potassium/proton antiporter ChaA n=1 Tax=Limnobaculum parvum TaxID=2172103 RepID=A0A2Y9U1J0_9GAMM|nr:sodium-potassium/proton antiporter ChaA [Limnobaculum parvum]AWH89680.1 sodium-potassium/proton antiporter ChaA [Limnobaculum parvum]